MSLDHSHQFATGSECPYCNHRANDARCNDCLKTKEKRSTDGFLSEHVRSGAREMEKQKPNTMEQLACFDVSPYKPEAPWEIAWTDVSL